MFDELTKKILEIAEKFSQPPFVLDDIAAAARKACTEACQEGSLKGFTLELNGVDCSQRRESWPDHASKGDKVEIRVNAADHTGNVVGIKAVCGHQSAAEVAPVAQAAEEKSEEPEIFIGYSAEAAPDFVKPDYE